jgi:hypothetical protein
MPLAWAAQAIPRHICSPPDVESVASHLGDGRDLPATLGPRLSVAVAPLRVCAGTCRTGRTPSRDNPAIPLICSNSMHALVNEQNASFNAFDQ